MYTLYENQYAEVNKNIYENDILDLLKQNENETLECKRLFNLYYNSEPVGFIKKKISNKTEDEKTTLKRKLKKDYSNYKSANLPFVQFNCITHSNKTHEEQFIVDYSGDMILDYDEITEDQILKITNLFKELPYTKLIFQSPSGKGLKCLIKISKLDRVKHNSDYFKNYFDFVSGIYDNQIKNILGFDVKADLSGKNPNRGCYIPNSPLYYYNPRPKVLEYSRKADKPKQQKITDTNISIDEMNLLRKYINLIYTNQLPIVPTYDEWIRLGFCIKHYISDLSEGKDLFNKASMFSDGYTNKNDCDRKYQSLFNGKTEREITIRYIENLIKKYSDYKVVLTKEEFETLKSTRVFTLLDVHRLMKQDNFKIFENEINKSIIISWDGQKEFILESSGNQGDVLIRKYFLENYNIDLKSKGDISYALYGYTIKNINPPVEYMKEWINNDGEEEFIKMIKLLPTEGTSLEDKYNLLKRFLLGAINNLTYIRGVSRRYDEMLILRSEGGLWGKTEWIRNFLFAPLLNWKGTYMYNESRNFSEWNKDKLLEDLTTVLNYKPEISKQLTTDPNQIKAYLSKETFTLRRAYRANSEEYTTRTTFIADTNDEYYLPQDSNLRRFLQLNITSPLQFKVKVDGKYVTNKIDYQKIWGWLYYLHSNGTTYEMVDIPQSFLNNIQYISTNSDDSIIKEIVKPQRDDNDYFTIDELIIEIKRAKLTVKDTSHESIRVKLKNMNLKSITKWDVDLKKNIRKYPGYINCMRINTPDNIPVSWES